MGEGAFGEADGKAVSAESCKDGFDVTYMVFERTAVNADVIQKGDGTAMAEWSEDVVHEGHEGSGSTGQSKRQD